MKSKIYILSVVFLVLVILSGSITAHAQEIVFTGEACPLTIYMDQNESAEIALETVNVLGIMDGTYAVVMYQNPVTDENTESFQIGYVSVEEIEDKIPALDLTALPSVENWTSLKTGSSGSRVQQLQEMLIEKGFLSGTVDGNFGPATMAGVNEFLSSAGLSQNGTVDAASWFLLLNDGTSEVKTFSYPYVPTVEEKFAPILASVPDGSLLEGFLDKAWSFRYDVFDQQGVIRKALDVEPFINNDKAIDRITVELELAIYLKADNDGRLILIPALLLCSSGAYRPYFRNITLNCGGKISDLSVLSTESSINRSDVTEEAYIAVTREAADAILNLDEGSVLSARLRGINRNYEIDLSDAIVEIREFLQTTDSLLTE